MATPGELVQLIANALGIRETTVVQYDRNLAVAGLRTKSGRGLSAAKVTSSDAAHLLIAIGGAPISGPSIKDTSKTCDIYRSLRASNFATRSPNFRRLKRQFPTLERLSKGHSFAEAISAFIDSISAGEFGPFPLREDAPHSLRVSFEGPLPSGRISYFRRGRLTALTYEQSEFLDLDQDGPDLQQKRTFSLATLSRVAGLLADKSK